MEAPRKFASIHTGSSCGRRARWQQAAAAVEARANGGFKPLPKRSTPPPAMRASQEMAGDQVQRGVRAPLAGEEQVVACSARPLGSASRSASATGNEGGETDACCRLSSYTTESPRARAGPIALVVLY